MTSPSPFGQLLRQRRRLNHFSQVFVADCARIHHTYLSKLETGAMPPPSHRTILRLAATLGDDPTDLLVAAGKLPRGLATWIASQPNLLRSLLKEHQRQLREKGAPPP